MNKIQIHNKKYNLLNTIMNSVSELGYTRILELNVNCNKISCYLQLEKGSICVVTITNECRIEFEKRTITGLKAKYSFILNQSLPKSQYFTRIKHAYNCYIKRIKL